MQAFDALVIGGGPAGSTCARALHAAGRSVAVLDRAVFPRVKLCAGWLSPGVFDALGVAPDAYPGGLWAWDRCHVLHQGVRRTARVRGYFVRRVEFDHWLLQRSGATVVEGHAARTIRRDGSDWVVDDRFRAPVLVGAGGTHCPVARQLFDPKPQRPAGALEHEFLAEPAEVAATRVGRDGEPELLLHDDLGGYSWNVPKSGWLNVGCGTKDPRRVRGAWRQARDRLESERHVPASAGDALDRMKGHSYYLFDPAHLDDCARAGAYLVGDALGLAQPLTAEGILPAILSGHLAARAILDGGESEAAYRTQLRTHPVFATYTLYARALALLSTARARTAGRPRSGAPRRGAGRLVSSLFAHTFSGRTLPGAALLQRLLPGRATPARKGGQRPC